MDARTSGSPGLATTPSPEPGRVPGQRTGRTRPAARPTPVRSQDFQHLSLEALRAYRSALQTEEGQVSYWRRILQARLDVVRAGRSQGGTGTLSAEALRPVLTDRRVTGLRDALVLVVPTNDVPPLPDLAELWERRVEPADTGALTALEDDLSEAEQQLSSYRTVLHGRLAGATDELIARYRLEPTLCLAVLPLRRGDAA